MSHSQLMSLGVTPQPLMHDESKMSDDIHEKAAEAVRESDLDHKALEEQVVAEYDGSANMIAEGPFEDEDH